MKKEPLILEHYTSLDDAERAREVLEDAGFHPLIRDEADAENGGVFALQVPESEAEEAEAALAEVDFSEEEGAMETLDDWEDESDEVRESFEQL